MTADDVRRTILNALQTIAPEIDPASIDPSADLRDATDMDSMDFLNLVLAVNKELGVDVPESDYGRLNTLDHMVAYVANRMSATHSEADSA